MVAGCKWRATSRALKATPLPSARSSARTRQACKPRGGFKVCVAGSSGKSGLPSPQCEGQRHWKRVTLRPAVGQMCRRTTAPTIGAYIPTSTTRTTERKLLSSILTGERRGKPLRIDDGQPGSAVRRRARTLEQPNRVAVLVYVYVVGCRIRTQARHGQHVACEGIDEARAHAGAHLAYCEGVTCGHVL